MRYNIGTLLLVVAVLALVVIIVFDRLVWDFLDTATEYLILGGIVGFIINLIAGLFFSHDQFSSSMARYRVKDTVDATKRIIKETEKAEADCVSRLRNKYRYSLGVIIDELELVFGRNSKFKEDEWPCLIDFDPNNNKNGFRSVDEKGNDKDRWDRFNKYVRPVVEDINSTSFIGNYSLVRYFSKEVRQLNALTELCNCLEKVVSELDAAFEAKSLVEIVPINPGDNSKVMIKPIVPNSSVQNINRLKKEYLNLHKAWNKWLSAAEIPCKAA